MNQEIPRTRTLHRGKMCLQRFGPCPSGDGCDSDAAEFRDEPPPPCGQEDVLKDM